jgi:hypothetical protein
MVVTRTLLALLAPSDTPFAMSLAPRDAPESGTRTTLDIIQSCIATIFACTWIAIHPNLPDPEDTKLKKFMKRVGVMMVALAVPEFILLWALKQRLSASSIMKEYNKEFTPGKFYCTLWNNSCLFTNLFVMDTTKTGLASVFVTIRYHTNPSSGLSLTAFLFKWVVSCWLTSKAALYGCSASLFCRV